MSQRFECEELDLATLEYLRTAHRHQGDGMPGIYLGANATSLPTSWLPLAGAIVGPLLIVCTLACTFGSVDDPINVAMLQTAGVFLGLWMVVAWMRSSIASKRPDYIGHFKLIDPLYLWHATGRGVHVTPLPGLDGAEVDHKYDNQGKYSGATVTIYLKRGKESVDVRSEYMGERLGSWLNLLADQEGGSAVERGYAALDELNQQEADQDREEDSPPVRRLVDAIPEPHKVRSVFTLWRYPVIVALLVVTFLCSWTVCAAMRDDEIFDLVKTRQPPELRAYVVDRRNNRHRADVVRLLAGYHDRAARQLEGRRSGDPQLTAGMASLVRALGHDPEPVITIAVKQIHQPDPRDQAIFNAPGLQTLRKELIKDLTEYLTPVIGQEIAAYGEVENGPAMIEITSTAQALKDRPGYRVSWKFTIQATPEAPLFIWNTQTDPPPGVPNNLALQQQYRAVKGHLERALPRS